MPRKNPLLIRRSWRATIAANAPRTQQWTYTVPIGRVADVQVIGAFSQNPGATGDAAVSIEDATGPIIITHTIGLANGTYGLEEIGLQMVLLPSGVLSAYSLNTGNQTSDCGAWLYAIEYDMSGFE